MKHGHIFALLAVLLAAALVYAFMAYPRQIEGSPRRVVKESHSQEISRKEVALDLTILQLPELPKAGFTEPKTNPFGSLFPAPVVVQKKRPIIVQRPVVQRPAPSLPPPVIIEEHINEPVFAPLPKFKVLGNLTRAGLATVFLEGEDGEVFVAKEGEELAMGMRIAKIGDRQVALTEMASGRTLQLDISELESQRLPSGEFKSGRVAYQQGQDREIVPESNVRRGKEE